MNSTIPADLFELLRHEVALITRLTSTAARFATTTFGLGSLLSASRLRISNGIRPADRALNRTGWPYAQYKIRCLIGECSRSRISWRLWSQKM
jgi:hypothetical protein